LLNHSIGFAFLTLDFSKGPSLASDSFQVVVGAAYPRVSVAGVTKVFYNILILPDNCDKVSCHKDTW